MGQSIEATALRPVLNKHILGEANSLTEATFGGEQQVEWWSLDSWFLSNLAFETG